MKVSYAFLGATALIIGMKVFSLQLQLTPEQPTTQNISTPVSSQPRAEVQANDPRRARPQTEACRTRPTREEGLVAASCAISNPLDTANAKIAFINHKLDQMKLLSQ